MLFIIILLTASLSQVLGAFETGDNQNQKIINGTDAKPGQYPYQISLQKNNIHSCGGSILSNSWALTAAHCVLGTNAGNLTILAGTTKLSEGGVRHKIAKYLVHEKYDDENDIALLQFESPLVYSDVIQPIKLPVQGREYPARTPVTLSGWGTKVTGGSIPDTLQTVNLFTFSDEECKELNSWGPLYPSHICAGRPEGNKGQCNGDSGGPLVAEDGTQVGIVSWSFKPCTKPPHPAGVYTQVSYFIDWIHQHALTL